MNAEPRGERGETRAWRSVELVPRARSDPRALLDAVLGAGGEGVVLKDPASRYVPGVSSESVKVERPEAVHRGRVGT